MTVEDKNCFNCDAHYMTGFDMTIEDTELCPSCEAEGVLLDCPTCDMIYYSSDDSKVSVCRVCHVRSQNHIVIPDILLVIGQGYITLDAFGERTEETYTSKDDIYHSLMGFRDLLESEGNVHVDIIYDTAHIIGGLRAYYLEEDFHVERLMADIYSVVNNAYEELTSEWIVKKV